MIALTKPAAARRTFLGALAALPFFGAIGTSFFATRADAATAAVMRQIREAEQRCHDTKQAFDYAMAACEGALPPLPAWLDMTKRRRCSAVIERRFFDNKTVKRGAIQYGLPQHRYIATVESLNRDLESVADVRHIAKKVRRLRRHAAKHEMAVRNAEKAHRLNELWQAHEEAKLAIVRLGEAIFDEPATTPAAVQVQARMLTAYVTAHGAPHQASHAAEWGDRLAAGVLLAGGRS